MTKRHLPLSAFLGPGAQWKGDLSFEGRVRIDGLFQGRIYSEELLEIGETGRVKGEVDVANAVVAGTVDGRLVVRDSLVVEASAVIRGELVVAHIKVLPGASIEAQVERLRRRKR